MKHVLAVASVLAFLVPTTHAQEGRGSGRGVGTGIGIQEVDGALTRIRAIVGGEVVKGAPYSAEIVNESTQTLSDGNRILRRTTSRVYRDSEGRVRREEDQPSGSPVVTINDPVAGTTWTLDTERHIARQNPGLAMAWNNGPIGALEFTVLMNGLPRVYVGGRGGFVTAGGEQNSEERLAPRTIEGLRVEGVRRTSTIPAGEIGNERPIVSVSEEWTSSELHTLVLSEHSDPRTGTSTYKLVRVMRGDPAPTLFQVPADYTVQSGPEGRGGREGAPRR